MASKILPFFFISTLILLLQLHISSAGRYGYPGERRGSPGGPGDFPGGRGGSPGGTGEHGFPGGLDAVRAGRWFPGQDFSASEINSTLFTHLFAVAADLDSQANQVVISYENYTEISTFTQTVQKINPDVKTLLSIGGGIAKKSEYASMASETTTRKTFIESSINVARQNNFHGVDFNWDYPSTPKEMTNYGLLLNEWRNAIQSESTSSGEPPLLLSSAVFHSSDYQTIAYPIDAVSNNLDWINVKAYDFYSPAGSHVTAPPAALYNPLSDEANSDKDYGVTTWINAGVPKQKVVFGIPYYGYAWRLADEDDHGFFAPTEGPALSSDGSVGYSEIREFIRREYAKTVYNETAVSNYAYTKSTWIGYDDVQTVATKVEYVKKSKMLGYFASHVHRDENSVLSRTGMF